MIAPAFTDSFNKAVILNRFYVRIKLSAASTCIQSISDRQCQVKIKQVITLQAFYVRIIPSWLSFAIILRLHIYIQKPLVMSSRE